MVGDNITVTFKFKAKITGPTNTERKKEVEIAIPLKYLSHF